MAVILSEVYISTLTIKAHMQESMALSQLYAILVPGAPILGILLEHDRAISAQD